MIVQRCSATSEAFWSHDATTSLQWSIFDLCLQCLRRYFLSLKWPYSTVAVVYVEFCFKMSETLVYRLLLYMLKEWYRHQSVCINQNFVLCNRVNGGCMEDGDINRGLLYANCSHIFDYFSSAPKLTSRKRFLCIRGVRCKSALLLGKSVFDFIGYCFYNHHRF